MKLLVDLFDCQTESRFRGIGRYTSSILREMIQQRGTHDIRLLANALYTKSFEELRQEYIRLLSPGAFKPYFQPPRQGLDQDISDFTSIAEPMVCQAYQAAAPDITFYPSVFESQTWIEQGVVPLPRDGFPSSKRAAILYDLIPYRFPEQYLAAPVVHKWYFERVAALADYDLLLAISEASRQDAIQLAGIAPEKVINISGAVTANFRKKNIQSFDKDSFLSRLGISRPFIFCGANHDYRKNLDGMIRAYGLLPARLRQQYQLVLNQVGNKDVFLNKIHEAGISAEDVVITGYIQDEDLISLYNLCRVFVFPSLYEGFGLPVLEAMSCGAAVIAANNSSIPEILDRTDALFEASDDRSIVGLLERGLTDDAFCEDLAAYGQERAKQFSWQKSAATTWKALEQLDQAPRVREPVSAALTSAKPAVAIVLAKGYFEGFADTLKCLGERFKIDVFVDPEEVAITRELGLGMHVFSYEMLQENCWAYDTVVYRCGFTRVPARILSLMRNFPGVVDLAGGAPQEPGVAKPPDLEAVEQMRIAHGLKAVVDAAGNSPETIQRWPGNWQALKYSRTVILHDEEDARRLDGLYHHSWFPSPVVIPGSGTDSSLQDTAEQYAQVIHGSIAEDDRELFAPLARTVSKLALGEAKIRELAYLAQSNWGLRDRPALLIDVTRIAQLDLKSGIQRVVKNIIRELVKTNDPALRIELVRVQQGKTWQAKRFTEDLFHLPAGRLGDECPIDIHAGDVFFLLDLELQFIDEYQPVFTEVRRLGGKVVTTIYDLIPLRFPQFCEKPVEGAFRKWIEIITRNSDQLLCISQATADDAAAYIDENLLEVPRPISLDFFHLGADIAVVPGEATVREDLRALQGTPDIPMFLMVGTVEPRKGHAFALDAFEELWEQGKDYRLCIAGRIGWEMNDFHERLNHHPQLGKRLFFIEKPSDAEINLCYSMATALVTASCAEGFGLPIWEAALHNVPTIASDIPVFHEIGGDGVAYFSLKSPASLAEAVDHFAARTPDERLALVQQIKTLSWQQSALWVLEAIYGLRPTYRTLTPSK